MAAPLCRGCQADLPALPASSCPQCADRTTHGERCGACLHTSPHFAATHALFPYEFPVDRLVQALKYQHRLILAPWLGQHLAGQIEHTPDVIVPLPLHRDRLSERGFNQAVEIARPLARQFRRPLLTEEVLRVRPTPPQAGQVLKDRIRNIRGAFECRIDLGGSNVLLVDDVMTSGATVNECARVLRLHGAGSVTVAVVARALR